MAVARERVQYLNAQGQLITESLRDYTRINLTRRFDSLDRFLQAWSDADRKAALLAELEGQGVLIDALADEVGRDLDPFDLLLHVAWNMPPLTRRERARRARTSSVFTQYGLVARKVLDALCSASSPSPSWAARRSWCAASVAGRSTCGPCAHWSRRCTSRNPTAPPPEWGEKYSVIHS